MSCKLLGWGFQTYLNDVFIGAAFVRFVVLSVFQQHVVHVGAGVLEQLVGAVEDDESDLTVAEDAQLVRLLHQTKLPLGEGYLQSKGVHISTLSIKHHFWIMNP